MDFNLPNFALDSISPLIAAGGIAAPGLPALGWFTNSILVAIIVTVAVLLFTRMATKQMQMIPSKKQNFVEFIVEFLYGQVEGIVGKHVAPKAFPLLATIFIFVITANWFGLIPGVGTIGWGPTAGPISVGAVNVPILRPATADLNMTLALALVFMVVWFWISVKELGVWGSLVHIFGPKGGLAGFLKYALMPIFFFVGIIEVISIVFRPVSLSLRLFGNVFAGETLLAVMGGLGKDVFGATGFFAFLTSVIFPIPFYFMEILVGALQATVFTLLCAVYIKLSTTHEGEDH
ncbi:F0F1 ATP synthase subunit A [Verrucomicrobiales bacterium]|jgi:F-type H+-transporting ATPase subunit a|nr:F0F1 ATP synthase subunit A [Verrucomicrobiales bacterium]MDA9924443.1 F0F1 ATP synthase subunit A [Verrucomicrobiales bacterium]MDB2496657.1 F0F1 ATP synthase subunit A [Verrucomicrobiales bacterium]MDB3940714.1 F0F1 ATP synthase subunit A [Verrucomicrobiales bacterium]MDC3352506.1 F0F1 ATP synthase subunit A [Verrucomicrobiales bacterium]